MARSQRSPPMKDSWRGEEEPRDRHHNRPRDSDRGGRRPRSPPSARRGGAESSHRGREYNDRDVYRNYRERSVSRDSRRSYPRKSSISPKRLPKLKQPSSAQLRRTEDRINRPRDVSPFRSAKRRRTQSPSPARSDRYVPDRRRESRSRERVDSRDRRPVIDRAFSPRRASPGRSSRPSSRGAPPDIDSYVPSHRRRSPTPPPARRRERRSPSPRRRSRTPPPRRQPTKPASPKPRELSPYSARVLKTQQLAAHSAPTKNAPPASKATSVIDDDHNSMDGQHSVRGSYGTHKNMRRGHPQRPYVETRGQQFGGSPPFQTPNSSYHGSPQSGSPQYNSRGGWHNSRGGYNG